MLDLTAVAHLVGDPSRLKMLAALLAEGELSAGELAAVAGVSKQTASTHLGKLQQGGLIRRVHEGYGVRHRVFRLTDDDVIGAVRALSALATDEPEVPRASRQHQATVCYRHLGGTPGYALLGALLDQGLLEPIVAPFGMVYDYRVTAKGTEVFQGFGTDLVKLQKQRRTFAGRCLNVHEANAHLSGSLAEALLAGLRERQWLVPQDGGKPTVRLTEAGRTGLVETFGIKL